MLKTNNAGMSTMETKALLSYKQTLINAIDPVYVAFQLAKYNCISKGLCQIIQTRFIAGISKEENNELLLDNVPFHTNLLSFIKVLDKCGYHRLSARLFLIFIKMQTGFLEVQKSRNIDRKNLHSFFRKLKIMIHDAQFKNPTEFLRDLAKRFMKQFEKEKDPAKKQRIADKVVAIIGAGIDAQAITFDTELPNNDMFSLMKAIVPYTGNTLITDVVYYGRLANANAIARNFEDGEGMLREARVRAYNTGPCLELVNMLYIQVYFLLWQYEQTPTKQIRDSLMMWGRIGIESLEEEEFGTKLMWRRMFIQRMVFCLLGIGNRANIIHGAYVDDDCAKTAENLLADFDQYSERIEQRRKMFYNVAKGRLYQYRGEFEVASLYVSDAEKLAMSGNFKELEFIRDYKLSLGEHEVVRVDIQESAMYSNSLQRPGPIPKKVNRSLKEDLHPAHMHYIHEGLSSNQEESATLVLPEGTPSEETELKQPILPEDQTFVKGLYGDHSNDNTERKIPDPQMSNGNQVCTENSVKDSHDLEFSSSELFGDGLSDPL